VASVPPKIDGIAVQCINLSLGPWLFSRRVIRAGGNAACVGGGSAA